MGYVSDNVVLICVCLVIFIPIATNGIFVKSVNNSSLLTFLKGDLITRNGRKCHDFCTSDWCHNGGTCVTDETTCLGRCLCSVFWTGPRCGKSVDTKVLSSFLHSLGNTSINGAGNPIGTQQEDDEGNQYGEGNELSDHFLTMLHGIGDVLTRQEFLKSRNGEHVVKKTSIESTERAPSSRRHTETDITLTNLHTNNLTRSECIQTCHHGDCIKINDLYKCKHRINGSISEAEKTCGPGFVCRHGVCDMEAKKNNSYDCICESNFVGQFCDHECPFDCGQHGFCDYDVSDSTYKCFCQWNYTGYNCSELIPTETEMLSPYRSISFHWYVLGVSVAMVVLIFTGTLLAGYFLWKRRLVFVLKIVHFFQEYEDDEMLSPYRSISFHWYVLGVSVAMVVLIFTGTLLAGYFLWKRRLVFVLKIVHFFQEYEDDDGKEFDAFVSYRASETDEKFVLTELYPRLEGTAKFKLCLHFRDFEPGEAIANNIVRAIENSRRTIMILSPSYVKSEWCRMEYQKAQHEMLKLKHKIIPIVLEDISEVKDMDMNLKSILDSVTYLQWPGTDNTKRLERFWTKLELSLPKKSSGSSSSSSSSSTISSEVSTESQEALSDVSVNSTSISVSSSDVSLRRPTLTIDIPMSTEATLRSPASTEQMTEFPKRRRNNFRQFIRRFVRAKLDFNRQDSNSSQAALVDEETTGSRSSCDSMSESNLTESTESICSTPVTAHTYLDEIGETCEPSSYFSVGVSKQVSLRSEKENQSIVCEKDHCEGTPCSTCLDIESKQKFPVDTNCVENVNTDIKDDNYDECEYCKKEQESADNNLVKISVIEGSDQIRIQRLRGVATNKKCNHSFRRNKNYRGSLKNHKEAVNRELSLLNRSGTLPRNFRSKILAKKLPENDSASNTRINRATSLNESNSTLNSEITKCENGFEDCNRASYYEDYCTETERENTDRTVNSEVNDKAMCKEITPSIADSLCESDGLSGHSMSVGPSSIMSDLSSVDSELESNVFHDSPYRIDVCEFV